MAKFEDVFEDVTKRGTKIPKDQYLESGKYQIIDQGQSEIAGYTNDEQGIFTDIPAIIFGDHTRVLKYVDKPLFLGADGVKLLKAKDKDANYKYLYYALRSAKIPDTGYNRHFKWLKEIEIPLPPKDQQFSIVAALDLVSKIISLYEQQLEKMDDLIKARFVEMFGRGDYPQTTISELVERKVSNAKRDFSPKDVIKYIDISSIDNKNNLMTGYTEYVLSEAPSRAQQHIVKNDIVISTVRPNLRNVAITQYEDNNLVASSGFCVLRAKKCLPAYLMAIACSDEFTEAMTKVVTGANYPAIKDSDVMGYAVSLPPMEQQRAFEAFTRQVGKSKFAVQKALDEAQTLFDSLMQHYFE